MRRQNRIYQEVTGLAADGPWGGRAAPRRRNSPPPSASRFTKPDRRAEQLKALAPAASPAPGLPPGPPTKDPVEERAARSLRRPTAFQTRAAPRPSLPRNSRRRGTPPPRSRQRGNRWLTTIGSFSPAKGGWASPSSSSSTSTTGIWYFPSSQRPRSTSLQARAGEREVPHRLPRRRLVHGSPADRAAHRRSCSSFSVHWVLLLTPIRISSPSSATWTSRRLRPFRPSAPTWPPGLRRTWRPPRRARGLGVPGTARSGGARRRVGGLRLRLRLWPRPRRIRPSPCPCKRRRGSR